jgi:hypothetical protein
MGKKLTGRAWLREAVKEVKANNDGTVSIDINTWNNLNLLVHEPEPEHPRLGTHLSHCNFGEYPGVCKYGDEDCPALTESWSWFGQNMQRAGIISNQKGITITEAELADAIGWIDKYNSHDPNKYTKQAADLIDTIKRIKKRWGDG